MAGLEMKYFVMRPKGDDIHALASRCAMRRYAEVIECENSELARQLLEWVGLEDREDLDRIKRSDPGSE